MLPFCLQVLSFFDQDFLPQRCDCGEAVTFHVNSLLQHLKNTNSTQGITEYSLRYFIKDRGIGCVGRQVHFRNRATQVSAAHIRREWFHAEDMDALDKCTYYFCNYILVHFTNLYRLFLYCQIWLYLKMYCTKPWVWMCNKVCDLVSSWNVYNYYDKSFKPLYNLLTKTFLFKSTYLQLQA